MPSDPTYKKIISLGDEISECCCVNYEDEEFFPDDQLRRLVNRHTVSEVLTTVNENEEALVDFALNYAVRLLLILVLMTNENGEKVSFMRVFHAWNLRDDCLPAKLRKRDDGWEVFSGRGSKSMVISRHTAPTVWSHADRHLFEHYQRTFLVPIFGIGEPFWFRFDSQTILPYLDVQRIGTRIRKKPRGIEGQDSSSTHKRSRIGKKGTGRLGGNCIEQVRL
ncbi:hypothetical protein LX36DRAFT_331426 [Colletotrichum falcatum]|nr:hypothetical protein LX36DRAFT_331426 [Colletotrichum falcatum]